MDCCFQNQFAMIYSIFGFKFFDKVTLILSSTNINFKPFLKFSNILNKLSVAWYDELFLLFKKIFISNCIHYAPLPSVKWLHGRENLKIWCLFLKHLLCYWASFPYWTKIVELPLIYYCQLRGIWWCILITDYYHKSLGAAFYLGVLRM